MADRVGGGVGPVGGGAGPVGGGAGWAPLALAYAGFIGLGLVSARLGVTWPAIRGDFGVPLDAVGALLLAHLAGSVLVSAGSGRLTSRLNIGALAAASCAAAGVALLGSAAAPAWALLVALSALTGLGTGALEASVNTYAANHFSPRAMNWLHASFGVGATIGPALMTALMAGGLGWRAGFAAVGAVQLALAAAFAASRASWRGASAPAAGPAPLGEPPREPGAPLAETLRMPVAWLAILLFVAFTGTQASAGQWYYSVLTEQRGVPETTAGVWLSLFWGSLTVGRVLFGFVVQRLSPQLVLRASMAGVVLSAALFWLAPPLSLAGILLLGLSMAPQFPLLISATPHTLGARHAANGVGLQVAAAGLGGVIVTSLVGSLARMSGLQVVAPAVAASALAMALLYELLARASRGSGAQNGERRT